MARTFRTLTLPFWGRCRWSHGCLHTCNLFLVTPECLQMVSWVPPGISQRKSNKQPGRTTTIRHSRVCWSVGQSARLGQSGRQNLVSQARPGRPVGQLRQTEYVSQLRQQRQLRQQYSMLSCMCEFVLPLTSSLTTIVEHRREDRRYSKFHCRRQIKPSLHNGLNPSIRLSQPVMLSFLSSAIIHPQLCCEDVAFSRSHHQYETRHFPFSHDIRKPNCFIG